MKIVLIHAYTTSIQYPINLCEQNLYMPFPNLIQFRPQLESHQEIVEARAEGTNQSLAGLKLFWSVAFVVRGWFTDSGVAAN